MKFISSRYRTKNIVICYASIDGSMSVEDVKALVVNDLRILGLGVTEIYEGKLWRDYFPLFSSYAVYRALLAAQGKKHTVYVGSINWFEFVETSIASSIAVIDLHFVDRIRPRREWFSGLRNMLHMMR